MRSWVSGGIIGIAGLYVTASMWRRRLREQRGVVMTVWGYLKLRYALRNGVSSLITIADFDRTLTSAACKTSCHGVVESCQELSTEYRRATGELFDHYVRVRACITPILASLMPGLSTCWQFPIETSPTLTLAEKVPLMQEWYKKAHQLLLKEPFTPELLDSAALRSAAALRPGCESLFRWHTAGGAPLIVCSAGLGNVVRSLLRQRLSPALAAEAMPELPIVSNWLHFDAQNTLCASLCPWTPARGTARTLLHVPDPAPTATHARERARLQPCPFAHRSCGFSEPLLHMFNKDGFTIRKQLGEGRWAALRARRSTVRTRARANARRERRRSPTPRAAATLGPTVGSTHACICMHAGPTARRQFGRCHDG